MSGSPQWSLSFRSPHQNLIYTPLCSPIRAAYPAHLILLDFITCTILGEEYRLYYCMCFNYSEADSTKENWDHYYWEAIKRTFGFGAFIVWCQLWFLPLQLLRAYSTVFIVADIAIESFVSCCIFTWVNVKTRELVILEMDRSAFQLAAADLSASTVKGSFVCQGQHKRSSVL
jgi:hypothetical protein